VPFPGSAGAAFEVVERIPARPGTAFSAVDFGALGSPCALDSQAISAAQANRLAAIVEASWAVLDDVVAHAPQELRKGPRGGGRDRDQVVEHVVNAEASYARKLGAGRSLTAKRQQPAALRADILAVLRAARSGDPTAVNGWSPRYAARRIAWHVLDHAWEIQDKSEA
jgi:hypothetical protein